MGEIADALRRARESRSSDEGDDAASSPGELSQALQRAREGRPDEEKPDPPTRSGVAEALRQAEQARSQAAPPARGDPSPDPARNRPAPPPQGTPATPRRPAWQTVAELEPTSSAIAFHGAPTVEACRRVAVRVREYAERRGVRSVAITSGLRAEGKTTVLCNLGLALAAVSQARAVALVDLDLRKPSLARVLGVRPEVGIEDVLAGRASLDDARIVVERPTLDLYPARAPQVSAHELLVTRRFGDTVAELESRYDLVLVDTPPTLVVPDVSLMLRHIGACILIARCGVTRTRSFTTLVETLPRGKILGEVLNEAELASYAYQYGGEVESGGPVAQPEPRVRRRGLRRRQQQ